MKALVLEVRDDTRICRYNGSKLFPFRSCWAFVARLWAFIVLLFGSWPVSDSRLDKICLI